ncbi:MAG: restriction endonuclease subunit S [Gammaproteobacteria bacterium]|nr:restriction endonuclease subunit S [Gammaproteobacteria bacterium]
MQVFAIDTTFFVDQRYTDADIRWLFYLLGWLRLDTTSKDSAVPGLGREEAYVRVVPLPPRTEQVAIVRFLDHAIGRIERDIRAKEKLIALLEEQKRAMVHEAVMGRVEVRTGKPYETYKSSGIQWLGDVPAHWDVRPAKWHLREVDERSVTGAEEMLSVSHLTGVTPRSEKSVTMFKAESNIGHKLCEPGDLVINTMWAWMGALGIAQQPGLVSPSYAVYRPKIDSSLDRRYAEMMLRSAPLQREYIMRSTGIRPSRLRLYPDTFLRIRLIAPPPEEQSAIIAFVASEMARCDRASRLMTKEIAALQEYRARLVADVITGKLNVRRAAADLDEVRVQSDLEHEAKLLRNA